MPCWTCWISARLSCSMRPRTRRRREPAGASIERQKNLCMKRRVQHEMETWRKRCARCDWCEATMSTRIFGRRYELRHLLPLVLTIASATASAQDVYAVPDSVASDCSEDVTVQLASFIASVP